MTQNMHLITKLLQYKSPPNKETKRNNALSTGQFIIKGSSLCEFSFQIYLISNNDNYYYSDKPIENFIMHCKITHINQNSHVHE